MTLPPAKWVFSAFDACEGWSEDGVFALFHNKMVTNLHMFTLGTIKGVVTKTGSEHRWAILSLFAVWLIFFSPIIFQQKVYFLDDLKIIYYPLEHEYAQAQSEWRLPEWSPYFGFGQPLLAWGQLGFFTPLHVVLRLFGMHSVVLLQFSIMLYFALGLAGMYAFLRRHVGTSGAIMGALLYVFSGFHVAHITHVNFYTATMLLSWLLLSINVFLDSVRRRSVVWIILFGAAMALSGQPQVVLYSYTVALIYALVLFGLKLWKRQDQRKYVVRVVVLAVVAIVVTLLLSSFALLPLAEFLPLTERDDALAETELAEFSYAPWHAVTLVLPYFFGDYYDYSGVKGFQELAAYVGIVPLLLAGIGLWFGRKRAALYWTALVLLGVSLLFAPGQYSPLYTFLITHKYLTTLAVPGRFVFFFIVGITLLAALGLTELTALRLKKWQLLLSALCVPVVLLLPFVFKAFFDPAIAKMALQIIQRVDGHLLLSLISAAAVFMALVFARNLISRKVLVPTIVTVVAATLLIYGRHYTPLTPRAEALAQPALAQYLSSEAKDTAPPLRVYSRENIGIAATPKNELSKHDRSYETQALMRHTQAVYGISSARWIGALSIRPYRQFIEKFFANDGEPIDGDGKDVSDREKKIFDMSGITHLTSVVLPGTVDTVIATRYQKIQTTSMPNYEARLYSNPGAFPKAYSVFDATFLDVPDEIRASLLSPTYDVRMHTFISGPTPPTSLPDTSDLLYKPATITHYSPTKVEVTTNNEYDAVLVLNDSTTPQWHTYIDGESSPYYLAQSIFRAAIVPAGSHTVSFEYDSPAVNLSQKLTLLGVLCLVFLAVPLRHRKFE